MSTSDSKSAPAISCTARAATLRTRLTRAGAAASALRAPTGHRARLPLRETAWHRDAEAARVVAMVAARPRGGADGCVWAESATLTARVRMSSLRARHDDNHLNNFIKPERLGHTKQLDRRLLSWVHVTHPLCHARR